MEPGADLVCWLGVWLSNNPPLLGHHLCCQQAENVLALVNARTAAAADSALAGLQGGLGQLVAELRGDVLGILTELEARLDFDEDLPPLDVDDLVQDITGETLTAWKYACHCVPVKNVVLGGSLQWVLSLLSGTLSFDLEPGTSVPSDGLCCDNQWAEVCTLSEAAQHLSVPAD